MFVDDAVTVCSWPSKPHRDCTVTRLLDGCRRRGRRGQRSSDEELVCDGWFAASFVPRAGKRATFPPPLTDRPETATKQSGRLRLPRRHLRPHPTVHRDHQFTKTQAFIFASPSRAPKHSYRRNIHCSTPDRLVDDVDEQTAQASTKSAPDKQTLESKQAATREGERRRRPETLTETFS